MDFFIKHWATFPRRYPSPSPLVCAGDLSEKTDWIHGAFTTCNFSFILRGRGEFRRKNRVYPVRAPYVITQWPGEHLDYGPAERESWHEVFLIFDAKCMPWFRQRGFVDESRPVWPIQNEDNVLSQIDELRALAASRRPEMLADRADRICDRLILESLLPGAQGEVETTDEVVQTLVLQLRQRLHEVHDFDQMAREHGLSASTLRRRWCEALKVTPGRYLLNLRIQKARRLLAETTLPVGEIAVRTGFQDVLYFSRRFKLETALTPSEYRQRCQVKAGR